MWRMLAKSLLNGVATTRYPAEPDAPSERFRGRPVLDPARCTQSGDCVASCPTGAIRLDDDPGSTARRWTIDYGACLFCGECARACPSQAIRMTSEFELTVRDRADLVQTTTLARKEPS
ncbi:MAG TPA: 4Fe-4S dicluster domain-containing protein [Oscillatoriaceae cyanobacterium]